MVDPADLPGASTPGPQTPGPDTPGQETPDESPEIEEIVSATGVATANTPVAVEFGDGASLRFGLGDGQPIGRIDKS